MDPRQTSLERALEDAVSRALRDNLAPLQRTANELHQAYADLVAACASTRPSNALPAMLRAQTAAAALAAGLSVLSNFVAAAMNPRDVEGAVSAAAGSLATVVAEDDAVESEAETAPIAAHAETETPTAPAAAVELDDWSAQEALTQESVASPATETEMHAAPEAAAEVAAVQAPAETAAAHEPVHAEASHGEDSAEKSVESSVAEVAVFDLASLPPEMQDLHRRANRVAKVAMQDIKLLRPKDVQAGREHKDLCDRLRVDLDKARKEYDRRFRAISDHPVDYFHQWMLEILAGGDSSALGEYPYPSALVRH